MYASSPLVCWTFLIAMLNLQAEFATLRVKIAAMQIKSFGSGETKAKRQWQTTVDRPTSWIVLNPGAVAFPLDFSTEGKIWCLL